MNKIKAKYIAVPFLVIIFLFFFINIFSPKKMTSNAENRNLEKSPTVMAIKDGTFAVKFEKYYTDQFVFREELIRINRMSEVILNKSVIGNYYIGEDNWILGKFPLVLPAEKISLYSDAINQLSQFSKGLEKDVYFSLTPHKTNMLRHLYPEFVDDKDNIDINKQAFRSALDAGAIKFLDLDSYMLNKFSEKELEKLYFKTDHHWNGAGAFESFKMMTQRMQIGVSDKELNVFFSKYKTLTYKEKEFVGSYNRNLNMVIDEKEYPSYVYLEDAEYQFFHNDGKSDIPMAEEDVIATFREREKWDYGGAYIRGEVCNILKIKNENSLTGKKLLLFRDSYQAPTTWLFADVFREVSIIDPRNIENIDMSYEEMIKDSDADIVMFMYNSSGFDSMIQSMIEKGL